jgi:hypothetical protein
MVLEAGGVIANVEGGPFDPAEGSVCAANAELQPQILERLKAAAVEVVKCEHYVQRATTVGENASRREEHVRATDRLYRAARAYATRTGLEGEDKS